jgi:hypothetical protein
MSAETFLVIAAVGAITELLLLSLNLLFSFLFFFLPCDLTR